MQFQPKFCPRPDCPSHSGAGFHYQCAGIYRRRCDRRIVPRFECLTCERGFSSQTFRVDYRLKRPELLVRLFAHRVSKVTHRQSARILPCSRSTEERHFRRLSAHCRDFHEARLAEVAARGGLGWRFQLDEMETYEHHRIKKPVTVPLLIESGTGFVLHVGAGRMAPRVRREQATKEDRARRSDSVRVVRRALRQMAKFRAKDRFLEVYTDEKFTYQKLLRELFGERCFHVRISSKVKRDLWNPLWPVNHTAARLRDGISRLVRETWAAAKKRRCLREHAAIWICYRNYVRGSTNKLPRLTPAMALRVQERQWKPKGLLTWRVFHAA